MECGEDKGDRRVRRTDIEHHDTNDYEIDQERTGTLSDIPC